MARSLTVQQEENPSTSRLLDGFLLLAVVWMLLGAVASTFEGADAAEVPAGQYTSGSVVP